MRYEGSDTIWDLEASPCLTNIIVGGFVVTPLILTSVANAEDGSQRFKTRTLSVENLSTFQKADEIADYLQFSAKIIAENIGPDDAPAAIRLAILDAGTYDIAAKLGGVSGAVALNPSSLEAGVKPLVEKLTKAKKAIDEVAARKGSSPISWADLIYLAGRSATRQQWRRTKEALLGDRPYDGAFDNPWEAAIGRVESSALGPNKVPSLTASVEEITAYMAKLGAKPDSGGFLAAKPPFLEQATFLLWTASAPNPAEEEARFAAASPKYAEIKKKYDSMRRKVLPRGDYEIVSVLRTLLLTD